MNNRFYLACKRGEIDIVRAKLNKGFLGKLFFNINAVNPIFHDTAIMVASKNGHIDVVKLLIEKGADISMVSKDNTALLLASRYGQIELVKILDKELTKNNTTDP